MNFYFYYISRIFAMAFVMLIFIGVASTGVAFREKRVVPKYRGLGMLVADSGTTRISWLLWPPQAMLRGAFHGHPFQYSQANRRFTHLMVECRPAQSFERSRRGLSHGRGPSMAEISAVFPGWQSLNAFLGRVPLTKRSLDRRPLGFGSAPGVDLYRENSDPFNAEALRADLSRLNGFCSEASTIN